MPDTNPLNLTPVGAALSAGQSILGAFQAISGGRRMQSLLQRVQPFQTPEEVYDILKLTQNQAQFGYDPATLSYLTGETDRAFSSTLNTAERLGGNANTLSDLFDRKIQNIMKIGAENHALNMENISRYLNALSTVADNKAAEQKSKQDILKDQIQAAAEDKRAGLQNIFGGINSALGFLSADQIGNLFGENLKLPKSIPNRVGKFLTPETNVIARGQLI